MKQIWVEQYRPKTMDEYVFKDENQKQQVAGWIADKSIPHLLFSGSPGTGKTTLAKVLINELGILDADVMIINASKDNGVEMIRKKITNFSETISWGDFKIILLDEADYISAEGQAALRGVMEQYSNFVRFILTCNYRNKIIPAIESRCQGFHIKDLNKNEFTHFVAKILVENEVEFADDTLTILDQYVSQSYPDLRKTINNVQMNVVDGKLTKSDKSSQNTAWRTKMIELFKQRKIREAREVIIGNCGLDEYEGIYQWLYQNVTMFSDSEDKQDEAIVIIRDGIVKHTQVANPEINLSAMLVDLANLEKA